MSDGQARNADKIQHKVPYRPCLNCGLDIWPLYKRIPQVSIKPRSLTCWCGTKYAPEVLDQISTSEWFCAYFEEGYKITVSGDTVTVTKKPYE